MHLQILGINQRPYMFFPANFWPHKNHRMLLTAYGLFLSQNPDIDIDIVLTGAFSDLELKLKNDAGKMGLEKRVHFLGTINKEKLSAVWRGCSFLIYPSLYETSCINFLEAFVFQKPIVCSNFKHLTKIAQDAAVYFDPRKPEDIADKIKRIVYDFNLRCILIDRCAERMANFLDGNQTPRPLEVVFFSSQDAIKHENIVFGINDDGWTDPEIIMVFESGPKNRSVEFHFEAPSYLPYSRLNIYLKLIDSEMRTFELPKGTHMVVRQNLPRKPGYLSVWISPVFPPSEIMGGSSDLRILGCLCHGCWLVSPQQERITLFRNAGSLDENRI